MAIAWCSAVLRKDEVSMSAMEQRVVRSSVVSPPERSAIHEFVNIKKLHGVKNAFNPTCTKAVTCYLQKASSRTQNVVSNEQKVPPLTRLHPPMVESIEHDGHNRKLWRGYSEEFLEQTPHH